MDQAPTPRRLFWLLFAAGALLRLAALALDAKPRFFLGDSHSYLSTHLGHYPPDRSWTYGLALSLLFEITHRLSSAIALQCVLTALTIALVVWTVLRAGLPLWAGALLALALHLDPLLFYYERSLLTETASVTALVAGLTLCILALRTGSAPAALAAAVLLTLSVSLRTVFLPAVVWVAVFGGVHGLLTGRPPRVRLTPRGAGAALACATVAGLAGYALLTGSLIGRRPAINPNGGFMLIGAVAPLLEPADFAGTELGDARTLLEGTRHREWTMRNAQIYNAWGIADRLRQRLAGEQAAADAAAAAAQAAILRNPAGFARLALRQAAEYFDGALYRARFPDWAVPNRPLPEALLDDLRRRVVDAPAAMDPAVQSPALGYLRRAAVFLPALLWAAVLLALCSFSLLPFVSSDSKPGLALVAGAVLVYLGSVFAFSVELVPRYLYPLVPLVSLAAGLFAASLREAVRTTGRRAAASGDGRPGRPHRGECGMLSP